VGWILGEVRERSVEWSHVDVIKNRRVQTALVLLPREVGNELTLGTTRVVTRPRLVRLAFIIRQFVLFEILFSRVTVFFRSVSAIARP